MRTELQQRLQRFMNHPVMDVVVMILIIASIVLLLLEVTARDPERQATLHIINEGIVIVFIVELLLRYFAETKKRRFFTTYWIDIIAVVPFLRPLRVLRVFRLMRVFRFGVRLSRKMGWISGPLQKNAASSFGVFMTILILVLFGGIGLRVAEVGNNEFVDMDEALWMSLMSLVAGEPIGPMPETTLGRMIALTVMIAGLVIFATLTGVVSAVMVTRLNTFHRPEMDIDELDHHIVICGWNRSGNLLISEFQQDPETRNRPIVVVGEFESKPTWPNHIRAELIYTVVGDFTKLEALESAGVDRASHAIILADSLKPRSEQDRDARTVLAALLIERLNKGIFTSVQLLNRDNASFLTMVGVEEVVVAEEYAACIIASATKNEGIVPMLDELLTSRYGNQIYKVALPPRLVGSSIADASAWLKIEHDATLIGIEEDRRVLGSEARMLLNPPSERTLNDGEMIVVIAVERPSLQPKKRLLGSSS